MTVIKQYPGSMPVMYETSRAIIDNVRKRLPRFFEFKAQYTEEHLENIELLLSDAIAAPDDDARTAQHEIARGQLVIVAAICLKRFRSLKRYIATAFPSETESYYMEAGWANYEKAAGQSWSHVSALCNSAISFITNHSAALQNNHNMPGTFKDLFISDFAIYEEKRNIFTNKLSSAKTGTESKLVKNNTLYRAIIECCLDGYHIFEDDGDAIRSEYSYEAVSEMISPGGSSALAFQAEKEVDGVMVPMSGVDIQILGTDIHETTNDAGRAEVNRLKEGLVRIRATADGCEDVIIDTTLDGTRRMLKIVMVPLFEGEMNVGSEEAPVSSKQ